MLNEFGAEAHIALSAPKAIVPKKLHAESGVAAIDT